LTIPDDDASSSSSVYSNDMFIEHVREQLRNKLATQDRQLTENKTTARCPLSVQRRQLAKDIDDLHLFDECRDLRRLHKLIEQVEHMDKFSRCVAPEPLPSATGNPSDVPSSRAIVGKSTATPCSYRVRQRCRSFGARSPVDVPRLD
jgi:hypothetical protein